MTLRSVSHPQGSYVAFCTPHNSLCDIQAWMSPNFLKLNVDKTKLLLIESPQHQSLYFFLVLLYDIYYTLLNASEHWTYFRCWASFLMSVLIRLQSHLIIILEPFLGYISLSLQGTEKPSDVLLLFLARITVIHYILVYLSPLLLAAYSKYRLW